MTITVGCARCGAQLRVGSEMAGRHGKCPKCRAPVSVPNGTTDGDTVARTELTAVAPLAQPSPTQPSAPAALRDGRVQAGSAASSDGAKTSAAITREILAGLSGRIEPVRSSLGYKAAVLLVFGVMLLLPLIYLGIIAAVGYGVYLHVLYDTWMFKTVRGGARGGLVALALYLLPVIAGGTLILFMCKPFFARPTRREKPRSLTRQGEPLLFAFVEKLCAAVGAKCPKRIDVDCQINAAAGFRRGWWSMLGNDMVLVVGLPLVAGLNLRQFAGVLAHEFGHFTQGLGMRLSYVVRSINFWLTRVVYERDAWDQWLADWSRTGDFRVQIIFYFTRGCVWLTRRVLWVLMMVGHGVSGVLLRQMEFDADLHEARLAGSEAFETTCRRLAVLGVATSGAYADLHHWYRDSRLGDSLPPLILAHLAQIPAEVRQLIDAEIDQSRTAWLDTHPANSARIARAAAADEVGLFHDERPATAIFKDFAALSKAVTFDFYKATLGPQLKITDLHPTDALLARQERENAAARAAARYFQNAFRAVRPLPFGSAWIEPPKNPSATLENLRAARQRMAAEADAYRSAVEEYVRADATLVECEQAAALQYADFKVKPTAFSQPLTSSAQVKQARTWAIDRRAQLVKSLEPFEHAAAERLSTALELLQVPAVAAQVPNSASLPQRSNELLAAAVAIKGAIRPLLDLRNAHAAGMVLVHNLQGNEQNGALINALTEQMRTMQRSISDLRGALANVDYPFKHGRGKLSVAAYCTDLNPPADDLGGLLRASDEIIDRLPALLVRLMGQLALIGELVEKAAGLPPLKGQQA